MDQAFKQHASKVSQQVDAIRHYSEENIRLQAVNKRLNDQVSGLSLELSAILTLTTEACEEFGIDLRTAESPLDLVAILIEHLRLHQGDARPQGAPLK